MENEEPLSENEQLNVIEEPIVNEPVIEEESVIGTEPVLDEPIIDEPVTEEESVIGTEPVLDEPVTEEDEENIVVTVEEEEAMVEDEPVIEEEPVVEEPVTEEEPVVEEPAAEEEPVTEEEPVVEEHVTEEELIDEIPPPDNSYIELPESSVIPEIIFIIAYRDRIEHHNFFSKHMRVITSGFPENSYKFYYIHQTDKRDFNRGAMKNIGFLKVKEEYPDNYKDIVLVFNDIDTMPFTAGFLNYKTTHGIIKHFYGLKFALGGIVSIMGGDFENINGFPNFWSWGYEDNMLYNRAIESKLIVDRTSFYPLADKNILQLFDGTHRNMFRSDFDRYVNKTTNGLSDITNLKYSIQESDKEFVNVESFEVGIEYKSNEKTEYDLKKGNIPFRMSAVNHIQPIQNNSNLVRFGAPRPRNSLFKMNKNNFMG